MELIIVLIILIGLADFLKEKPVLGGEILQVKRTSNGVKPMKRLYRNMFQVKTPETA
jgi:hypothetical protein